MNPFASLISQVTTARQAPPPRRPYSAHSADRGNTKAEAMRKHLMHHGEATAADLAAVAQLKNTGLVHALLKWDIGKGAVERCGKFYRLSA